MSQRHLQIRELAAWGFNSQAGRGSLACEDFECAARKARRKLEARGPYQSESPLCVEETRNLASEFAERIEPVAASGEFDGLAWQPAIVDLRKLIAFQRQIRFACDDDFRIEKTPTWRHLFDLALPINRKQPHFAVSVTADRKSLTIRTQCPSLTVQFAHEIDNGLGPVQLVARAGSPYFEVASYRGRWFLRDGYHRSFLLLKQGICHVPAVVVCAETLTQLGAVGHKFFTEDVLFSERPPMVKDFLDEEMVACFAGPRQQKVMRVSIQELWEPVEAGCRVGEDL
jgi:hypothetical protein